MGNQPSVEGDSRRAPQKLSKPRVGNHASSTNNLLSPNTAASSTAHFSNSYQVSPPPAPAPSPEAGLLAIDDSPIVSGEAIVDDNEEAQTNRKSGLFRSATFQADNQTRRKSTGLATSKTFDGSIRPQSVVQRPDLTPLSPALGDQVSRRPSFLDLPSQTQRAVSPKSPKPSSPIVGDFNDTDNEISRLDSNQQALDALLGRSQSEVSLYAPSRRRSAILTPGVATRAEQPETSLSTKKSFRKSLQPPNRPRRESIEPLPERPVSMLSSPPTGDTPERLATPSETDYRQLGGMKFGSLRITNGVPSPSPGSESGHSNRRNPLSIDKSSLSHAESAGEIKHPQPVSPSLALSFSDGSTAGLGTSSEKEYSPFSAPTSGGFTVDGVSPAAHPSIATTPEEMEKKTDSSAQDTQALADEGPHRSDSGYGSGSGSSGSQAEPSLKKESGHGSSLSLKSLFGSRKKSQRLKEAAKEQEKRKATQATEGRPILKQNVAYEPLTTKTSQTNLKAQDAPMSEDIQTEKNESRRTGVFGSFRSRKAREAEKPKHNRGSSVPEIVSRQVSVEQPETSSGQSTEEGQKTTKLQKLSKSVRRRSLPNMMAEPQPPEQVPSMPSDAGEKVQEHTENYNLANKRFSLRLGAEKDIVRPVVVESREVHELPLHNVDGGRTGDLVEPVSPQPRHMARPASAIFRQSSTAGNRRSILRKPRPAPQESNDSGDEDDIPDYILGVEVQASSLASIRRSVGNSAFDAAFVPMTENNSFETDVRRRSRQSRSRPRTPDGAGPRLRSRSSAPDFLETVSEPASPGSISCYSQKMPKTPPPISIRTRGSKKRRKSKSRQPPLQQHPPMPGQSDMDGLRGGLDFELRQSLRSFPLSHSTTPLDPRNHLDLDVPYNRRASARPFYPQYHDQMGPYPPVHKAPAFHRPSPRPMDHHGRALHSYNSPAYKGVPIWS